MTADHDVIHVIEDPGCCTLICRCGEDIDGATHTEAREKHDKHFAHVVGLAESRAALARALRKDRDG